MHSSSRRRPVFAGLLSAVVFAGAGAAQAAPDPETEERLSALERAIEVLAEEQERLRTVFAVPEGGLQSFSGLAPAASKVYFKDQGLSIGGYGEWRGRFFVDDNRDDDRNELDALRAVLYFGYKFNDWIVFNSEFEFEHGGTGGGGDVSTEFMTLDFLFTEEFNTRAGLILVPMGFINEIHEPTFFFGAARPEVERRIIPSTWRENGAGIFGTLFDRVEYRMFAVNGFEASGFDSNGFRGGRQKGSEAFAEHFAFVARADVEVVNGFIIGGSVYAGNSGQNEGDGPTGADIPDAFTTIWEVHTDFKRWGLSLRALYVESYLDDAGALNRALGSDIDDAIARRMRGGYAEVAYEVLQWIFPETEMTLEPFYRYERLDTQSEMSGGFQKNGRLDRNWHVVGLQFKPHPQVVLKLDYTDRVTDGGKETDRVQVGFGYVF